MYRYLTRKEQAAVIRAARRAGFDKAYRDGIWGAHYRGQCLINDYLAEKMKVAVRDAVQRFLPDDKNPVGSPAKVVEAVFFCAGRSVIVSGAGLENVKFAFHARFDQRMASQISSLPFSKNCPVTIVNYL